MDDMAKKIDIPSEIFFIRIVQTGCGGIRSQYKLICLPVIGGSNISRENGDGSEKSSKEIIEALSSMLRIPMYEVYLLRIPDVICEQHVTSSVRNALLHVINSIVEIRFGDIFRGKAIKALTLTDDLSRKKFPTVHSGGQIQDDVNAYLKQIVDFMDKNAKYCPSSSIGKVTGHYIMLHHSGSVEVAANSVAMRGAVGKSPLPICVQAISSYDNRIVGCHDSDYDCNNVLDLFVQAYGIGDKQAAALACKFPFLIPTFLATAAQLHSRMISIEEVVGSILPEGVIKLFVSSCLENHAERKGQRLTEQQQRISGLEQFEQSTMVVILAKYNTCHYIQSALQRINLVPMLKLERKLMLHSYVESGGSNHGSSPGSDTSTTGESIQHSVAMDGHSNDFKDLLIESNYCGYVNDSVSGEALLTRTDRKRSRWAMLAQASTHPKRTHNSSLKLKRRKPNNITETVRWEDYLGASGTSNSSDCYDAIPPDSDLVRYVGSIANDKLANRQNSSTLDQCFSHSALIAMTVILDELTADVMEQWRGKGSALAYSADSLHKAATAQLSNSDNNVDIKAVKDVLSILFGTGCEIPERLIEQSRRKLLQEDAQSLSIYQHEHNYGHISIDDPKSLCFTVTTAPQRVSTSELSRTPQFAMDWENWDMLVGKRNLDSYAMPEFISEISQQLERIKK